MMRICSASVLKHASLLAWSGVVVGSNRISRPVLPGAQTVKGR